MNRTNRRVLSVVLVGLVVTAPTHAVDAPKGAARRWEASLPVGLYGQVNLRTGRVLTTIPITGWSGRGPSIQFNLYHNQNSAWGAPGMIQGDINEDLVIDENDIDPFIELMLMEQEEYTKDDLLLADFNEDGDITVEDLASFFEELETPPNAPDWRHSYSAGITVLENGDLIRLTRDDGTQDDFELVESDYISPPGTWDTLTRNTTNDTFTLKSKYQWQARFGRVSGMTAGEYRLEWISDSVLLPCTPTPCIGEPANKVTMVYEDNSQDPSSYRRLIRVDDAAALSRQLHLTYNESGHIKEITGPLNRKWKLFYQVTGESNPSQDGSGPLKAVDDPMDYRIRFTYTEGWDLLTVSDKNQHEFTMDYYKGRLFTITDPSSLSTQPQMLMYVGAATSNDLDETVYFDRRSKTWHALFHTETQNLYEVEDPLGHTQYLSYDDAFENPIMHEPYQYNDALNNGWLFGTDDYGNLYATIDPTSRVMQMDYDAFNNLISITPHDGTQGGSEDTVLDYGLPLVDPTAVTKITVPTDGLENSAADIEINYFNINHPHSPGMFRNLRDLNGVETDIGYDGFGQYANMREGPPPTCDQPGVFTWDVVKDSTVKNASGHKIAGFKASDLRIRVVPYPPSPEQNDFCIVGTAENPNLNGAPQDPCCGGCVKLGFLCAFPHDPTDVFICVYPDPPSCSQSVSGLSILGESSTNADAIAAYSAPRACPDFIPNQPYGNGSMGYDNMSALTSFSAPYATYPWKGFPDDPDNKEQSSVSGAVEYDALGRVESFSLTTNEPSWGRFVDWPPQGNVTRAFAYDYDDTQGTVERTGPDAKVTTVATDDASRASNISRDGLSASLAYDIADRVETLTNGNGTTTEYGYDEAGRVTLIHHRDSQATTILQMEFTYTYRGLIEDVTETAPTSGSATVHYVYDQRDQLVSEKREGFGGYWYLYTYDQGGNRQTKVKKNLATEAETERTVYTYDTEADPPPQPGSNCAGFAPIYPSFGNRLMYYNVYDVTTGGDVLRETTWYSYEPKTGHPRAIVTKPANSSTYSGMHMFYTKQGEVWMIQRNSWQLNGSGNCINATIPSVVEVRGEGRARRMVRRRSLSSASGTPWGAVVDGTSTWSDYDGDNVYADYVPNFSGNTFTGVTSTVQYLPGIAEKVTATGATLYYHADQIGSLRVATDGSGNVVGRFVYSAFGELITEDGGTTTTNAVQTRYKFGGAWQYETGLGRDASGNDPLPFVRIGYRWYDPSTGRFLQRDPIGIDGGLNTYVYCENNPISQIDPLGLSFFGPSGPLCLTPRELRILSDLERRLVNPFTRPGPGRFYQRARNLIYRRHLLRMRGLAGGGVFIAAEVGAIAGRAIDDEFGRQNNGFRISDGLADILWRGFGDDGSGYDPWGTGGR